ncbi:hypothetical protein PTKIN_Ptkin16aG0115500 [Pterospermum kingtungense]
MAEGLLEYPKEYESAEEQGNKNFRDLILRSFFHPLGGDKSGFVMHDLISDLAKSVAGEFFHSLDGGDDSCGITEKTRHLSNVQEQYDISKKFQTLQEAKSLRTFLTLKSSQSCCYISSEMPDSMIKSKCLRVLSLAKYDNIIELPEKIHELKLLRYLDLSETPIKCLPKSLTKLLNLQTLILFRCKCLVELPEKIGKLKLLRYLDLSETSIQRLPNSVSELLKLQTLILFECSSLVELPKDMGRLIKLQHLYIRETNIATMPKGIDELKDLRTLTDFVVGKNNGSGNITELGKLKHLCGRLAISGLENVGGAKDAKDANLKDKKKLKELELVWTTNSVIYDDKEQDSEVLEQLEPHANLECLVIKSYRGTTFPEGIGRLALSNVVSLELRGCKYCTCLPPLGQLSCLKSLSIEGFARVETVGDTFYRHCDASGKPFPSLESLSFVKMPKWKEWICSTDAFGHLQELYITGCTKLTRSLPEHLPSLKILEIKECRKLGGFLPRAAPRICQLELLNCDALQLEPLPCGLRKFRIDNSNINDSIMGQMVQHCTLLEKLTIPWCSDLGSLSLPVTLKQLRLEKLSVEGGRGVPNCSKIPSYTSLESLEIAGGRCHPLESFPLELFPKLNRLHFRECHDLKSIGALQGRHACLNTLQIIRCHKFMSFRIEEGFSATNLTSLELSGCRNLKSFPEQMHSLFPCLEDLSIQDCPEIESFPKQGLPSKLKSLLIARSDKLIEGMIRRKWSLQTLSSLTEFTVDGAEQIESASVIESFADKPRLSDFIPSLKLAPPNPNQSILFPDEHLLPSSLTCLVIGNFPNLKHLDGKGFENLTSLRELKISGCLKLESMPAKNLPTSLSYLEFSNCPLLEKTWEKEKGNISHIPVIWNHGKLII